MFSLQPWTIGGDSDDLTRDTTDQALQEDLDEEDVEDIDVEYEDFSYW